jgi:hypothetical protein
MLSKTLMWLAVMLFAAAPATAALFDCGQPISTGSKPTSADALTILRDSVGLATPCEQKPCMCDANGNELVQVSDALLTLKVAVGVGLQLSCPCFETTTSSSSTSTLRGSACPELTPLDDLREDCSDIGYLYIWDDALAEIFVTNGNIIALGQSDGESTLYYGGVVNSATSFSLSLIGTAPENLLPILDSGSGGSITNSGYKLNVTIKLSGNTYGFPGAVFESGIASIAATGSETSTQSTDRFVGIKKAFRTTERSLSP